MAGMSKDRKRAPERSCVICRGRAEKGALLRVVAEDGALKLDRAQSAKTRGAYLHLTWGCWSKMGQPERWARALKEVVSQESLRLVVDEIGKLLSAQDPLGDPGSKVTGGSRSKRVRL